MCNITHDKEPFLSHPRRKSREVCVARYDAKSVNLLVLVHDVHRVDDQGAVGRVLAAGVGELLHGGYAVAVEDRLPI
jgi:hypothetical protein